MPGRCTICAHAKRAAAEQAIASGESVRSVAKTLALSYQSLDRHTRNCVAKALGKAASLQSGQVSHSTVRAVADEAAEQRDVAFADCLMTEVEMLHRTTLDVLHESRNGKWLELPDPKDPNETIKVYDLPNVRASLRAIAEVRKNLALIARLTGQLEPKEDRNRTLTYEEFELIYFRAKREVRS